MILEPFHEPLNTDGNTFQVEYALLYHVFASNLPKTPIPVTEW